MGARWTFGRGRAMTEYPLTWLADVLRAEGCRVIEESGWKTRGRPSSTGTFKPRAILHHWDASGPGSHGAISTVINGSGDTPGPLCSILTCRGNSDHAPSVHIIAAGRANHGGTGDGWGDIPRDDANTYAVGHEIAQTSNQPWPADQAEQIHMAEAAILRKLGARTSDGYCAHSEYAPGRKIDTTEGSYGQNMNTERSTVQSFIDGGGGGGGDDDMAHDFAYLTCTDYGDVSDDGYFVKWDKEGTDQGNLHAEGNAGIKAPYECSMSGVVEVHVTAGQVDITVERYESGMVYKALINRVLNAKPGYVNVPFAGKFPKGEYLYVKVAGDAEGSVVGSVRINLDAFSV